jgi:hypothetical protein
VITLFIPIDAEVSLSAEISTIAIEMASSSSIHLSHIETIYTPFYGGNLTVPLPDGWSGIEIAGSLFVSNQLNDSITALYSEG